MFVVEVFVAPTVGVILVVTECVKKGDEEGVDDGYGIDEAVVFEISECIEGGGGSFPTGAFVDSAMRGACTIFLGDVDEATSAVLFARSARARFILGYACLGRNPDNHLGFGVFMMW